MPNEGERQAKAWLEERSHSVSRPKKDPPDFVIKGNTGVEVMRLVQQYADPHDDEGKTTSEIGMRESIGRVIGKAIEPLKLPAHAEKGLQLSCEWDYDKGMPDEDELSSEIRELLCPFCKHGDAQSLFDGDPKWWDPARHSGEHVGYGSIHRCLPCGVCVDILPLNMNPPRIQLIWVSHDSGMMVRRELHKCIGDAIRTKTKKCKHLQGQPKFNT